MADSQAQAEATETAAADAAGIIAPDTSKMDLAQLDQLFSQGSVELPVMGSGEGEAEAGAGAAAPTVVEEKPDGAIPPVEAPAELSAEDQAAADQAKAESDAEEAEEAKVRDRIQRPRLKNAVDQQIAFIHQEADRAGEPISWAEAERRVKGDSSTAAAEPVVVETTPAPSEVMATLSTEVEGIKARLTELGEQEGLNTPEHSKLIIELADKQSDLKLAQRDAKQAAQRAAEQAESTKAASQTNRAESRAVAIEKWPAADDISTPLGKAVAERIAAMKNPAHKDHAILYADSAPLTIVRDVAEELGIAPVAKAATPPVIQSPVVPTRKVVSPAPGNKTAVPLVTPAEDAKQTVEYLKNDASLKELDDFFGAGNVQTLLASVAR